MSVAPLLPTAATYVALSRARLHSKHQFHIPCILWLLLLCVFGYASSAYAQPTPYGGTAVTVAASGTTKVETENYDLGGEGVAFHDVDNGGQTGYRSDNIGVYSNGGASSGYAVGWGQVGEWSGYTLNVAAAGPYALTAHVGSSAGGGTFHLEFGPVGQVGGAGIIQSSEFTVPNTGVWSSYQDVTVPAVRLPAGPLWMRLVLDSGSTGCGPYVADFDCFRLTSITPGKPVPYNGSPITVAASGTTKVEMENYDLGGEGLAYHDMGNGGLTAYRSDNIGVYADNYASNSFAVGYAQAGEWDGYTLNVSVAGSYAPTAHLANPAGGGTFHLEFGPVGQIGGAGMTRSGEFTVPNTGSWGNYQDVAAPAVNLPAGPLWMRLVLDSASTGCGPYLANFDCFSLTPAGPGTPTSLSASAGSGQIILAWNASFGAVSYNLYRSTTAGGEGTTPYKTGLSGTSYTDTSVVPGTPYYYTVTAVNLAGESAPSNEASATARPATSPDFALTVNPSLNIVKGSAGTLDVNIASINNFIGTVNLSISGLPAGVTAAFSATAVTGSGGSTLTLTTDPNAAALGSTTLTVMGASSPSGLTHSQTLTLTITGPGGNLASGPVWLTDIYLPKTMSFACTPSAGADDQNHHHAYLWSDSASHSGGTLDPAWTDTFQFQFGTSYVITAQIHLWGQNWVLVDPPTNRYDWVAYDTTGTIGTLAVTPMQTLVTENQVVDARYDPRYSTYQFINHKFGTTTYRGGLFAGYNADGSQVGHSYLKFLLPPLASGQTVLPAASINAWFTRNYDLTGSPNPDSVGVACQSVPSYWNAASLTWANAPAFSPSQTPQIFSGNPQTAPWVHWKVGADVAGVLNAGGGPYSAVLSGTQEPTVGGSGPPGRPASGWAYFAKKEYGAGQPAILLYALSGSSTAAHVIRSVSPTGAEKTPQAMTKKTPLAPTQKKRQPKTGR